MSRRRTSRKRGAGQDRSVSGRRVPDRPQRRLNAAVWRRRFWSFAAACVIVAAGAAAYSNSFSGPFIFDDLDSIPNNPHIKHLWPITEAMKAPAQETTAGRPILCLSLAVSYQMSGLDVWGYHATNLAIHLLAGLTLFGVVRRTLGSEALKEHFRAASGPLALVCALIWTLHPLQTQAVTYIIQRAEALMGLFYLLTLYCAIRGFGSRRAWVWYVAAVGACALGMGTKEVMVTAPLLVLLYDWAFAARSFRKLLSRRWLFYAGLAATWAVLAAILSSSPRGQSAGFELTTITPLDYAKTQCQVILHYLRLAFWPAGQTLDYSDWPVPEGLLGLYLPAAGLLALLGLTVLGLIKLPGAGYLGAWFFLILGPTSSFVPINDVAFEHRTYLPLAGVVAGCVTGVYLLGGRVLRRVGPAGNKARLLAVGLPTVAGLVVIALGLLTFHRNKVYKSDFTIWQDCVRKRPKNHRAQNNLALAYSNMGKYDLAIKHYTESINLKPDYSMAYINRGVAYAKSNQDDKALDDFTAASIAHLAETAEYARLGKPVPDNKKKKYASVHNNRGIIYKNRKQFDLAMREYQKALELWPKYASALYNRAVVHEEKRQFDKAIADLDDVIRMDPRNAAAYSARGLAHLHKGNYQQAISDFRAALRLDANDAFSLYNRATCYDRTKQYDLAMADLNKVIRLSPTYAAAYGARGVVRLHKGDIDEAIADFDKAISLDPNEPAFRKNRQIAQKRRAGRGG